MKYRATAAPQASGYSEAGASHKRRALRAFFPNSNSPSSDIHDNADTLRQRSRMLYMSAPVATSAINTNRTKVVGTGLTLKSTIDRDVLGLTPEAAKEWQTKAEAEFRLWAENRRNCDAMGMNNFYGLQQLALKSWLMSGDVFAVVKIRDVDKLHPYALRLHLVEADRVSTPNRYGSAIDILGYTVGKNPDNGNKILDGVEVDSSGAVVAYHIRNTYPHEWLNSEETVWQRVEVVGKKTGLPQVLHIMESERPDQYRGVPLVAPIIEPLLQLRRYTESELLAALVQSYFTAWIVSDAPKDAIPFNETGSGDLGGVPVENPQMDNEQEGDLALLNMMERFRVELLKVRKVGGTGTDGRHRYQFTLDISPDHKLESIPYDEESKPYYAGEMITYWKLPTVQQTEDIELWR